jgi:signal transduction histidine kinase
MRVSTKIFSGFGILMIVGSAAIVYQLWAIHQFRSIKEDLASVTSGAAQTIQEIQLPLWNIKDYTRKYFALGGDIFYQGNLDDTRTNTTRLLEQLTEQTKNRRPNERLAVEQLSKAWNQFWRIMDIKKTQIPAEGLDPLPPDLDDTLDNLQKKYENAASAIQESIREQIDAAVESGVQAERFSKVAGGGAALIGILVAFFSVRAISEPLRHLTQGTHRIAKGQFWHRLPAYDHDEFGELARDFNVMTERLGELDQMKKDFVSHVSHDLKAPLASMRQVFHLLLQRIPGPLNEQQERLLRLSNNSAERLSAMVGNLLDVSRMEAGTMEYEIRTNDIVSLIRSVVEEFEIQAKELKIDLSVDSEHEVISVECDRDRIAQVIGNLLENALKFSPPGDRIVVGISQEQTSVVVSVKDSGPGVPTGHKSRIFEKFHQVKQGKKVTGQGVGLGLAICKTIVEAHKGAIWVEDNPSGGSVFCFKLPAEAVREMRFAALS